MDAAQQLRDQVEYYKRAQRHLLNRAKWLKRFRTKRTGVLSIDCPGLVTSESLAQLKSLFRGRGIPWTYSARRASTPRFAEFIIDAPNQSRALQVQHAFGSASIPPFRMSIEIDGSAPRCILKYAGFERMSEARWSHVQQLEFLRAMNFPREPEGDVDYILDLAEGIINDRLILLRYVYWGECGHGSVIMPLMTNILVDSHGLIQPPSNYPSLQWAAEAIVYTWSGAGDRQIIVPRYAEMRARSGG